MPRKQSTARRTDEPIETADAVLLATNTPGDALVSLNIEATADASYAVDVHHDVGSRTTPTTGWFEDEIVYDQADVDDPQDIRDTFYVGDAWLRVRVTDPAGAGETADVTIQEAH
ncbi:hypothetical protein C453_12676 [Haloferax elongans ATCC BAA-1513]|uniref:Uncharacterized protein n=1 Tax=Haloferax elongans ATCC BAA-1513 TaxID=1230453 RepID=M0HIL9_HALEO|nr:hypothetical protein [Haloferax elongans]ELZ84400.1 hypothetical protein C453_12676 [Haloferax elongans ATCC BAA-1513]